MWVWEKCALRARELQGPLVRSRELLEFYARLCHWQNEITERMKPLVTVTSVLETVRQPLPTAKLVGHFRDFLAFIERRGPPVLGELAHVFSFAPDKDLSVLMEAYWGGLAIPPEFVTRPEQASMLRFLAKGFLQPLAYLLAQRCRPAAETDRRNRCPLCGGPPQVSAVGEDGRRLQCSLCLTSWKFEGQTCAACLGAIELRPGHDLTHVALEVCGCRRYLKRVDLAREPGAVPLADEVAAAELDIAAQAEGLEKIELNAVGL